jgi:regulator of protease activity HflC (stomatin/prohibitin superfamily)
MKDIGESFEEIRKAKMGGGMKTLVAAVAVVILALILNPFVIIGPGERGVVMTFGAVRDRVMGEGLNVRIPLVQRVVLVDVRVHKSQVDAEAASKDMQDATSTIAVNYHVSPERVNVIFQTIGVEYKDRIIDPSVQEAVKAVTAKYTAVELITQRERVRSEIKDLLRERLMGYNIIVDDFSVVNFKFSRQFTEAIESKQTAEQLALKAQRDLERIKIEAEQKVASARAEAESLRLQKENVSPLLVELRRIEATMKAIDKWDGKLPKVTGGAMPFLDLKTLDDGK